MENKNLKMLNQVLRYVRKFNFSGPEACLTGDAGDEIGGNRGA